MTTKLAPNATPEWVAKVQGWSKVKPYPDGSKDTCVRCHSTDIHKDPSDGFWACGGCGYKVNSYFLGFGLRTCPNGHTTLPGVGREKVPECAVCGHKFNPPV